VGDRGIKDLKTGRGDRTKRDLLRVRFRIKGLCLRIMRDRLLRDRLLRDLLLVLLVLVKDRDFIYFLLQKKRIDFSFI
jgi:hypothetical protein